MIFHTPCIRRPVRVGGGRRNISIPFGMEKLEWWDYPMVENFEDMHNHLHTIPARDGQTDEQTSCHGIVRTMHTRRAVNAYTLRQREADLEELPQIKRNTSLLTGVIANLFNSVVCFISEHYRILL